MKYIKNFILISICGAWNSTAVNCVEQKVIEANRMNMNKHRHCFVRVYNILYAVESKQNSVWRDVIVFFRGLKQVWHYYIRRKWQFFNDIYVKNKQMNFSNRLKENRIVKNLFESDVTKISKKRSMCMRFYQHIFLAESSRYASWK